MRFSRDDRVAAITEASRVDCLSKQWRIGRGCVNWKHGGSLRYPLTPRHYMDREV